MKKIIILFVLLTSSLIYAQNAGITYQAVIYNPSTEILPGVNNTNAILSNKEICLRFSILDATSNLEYQETQRVKTDHFGMVNLIVGLGNQVGGSAFNFNSIVWNSNQKKMKVEIDVKGTCSNFIEVSNQDFSAVPFAYASKVAESVSGIVPIINGGTGSSTVSGAKTNLGLNNVDNTSDANKPISIATQNALNTKEDKSNKSTTTTLGTSDLLYPTQNAVKVYVDTQISNATILDATSNSKGKLKLAGDLGGTADAPTVPGLANKENTITSGTTSQFWRGDKTWQDLTKSTVGLSNVDNTSDANKPISNATQTALNAKEDSSNKSTNITLGTSDVLYPTQNAVKTYVDNQVNSGVIDATSVSKGKLKLAGDLGGTADAPTVPGLANKENTITSGTTSQFWRGDKTWQALTKSTVGLSNVDNTSDINKPISNATQTALNGKEDSSNKSTNGTLGTSDVLYPTQNAVKTYVDGQIAAIIPQDATSTDKGNVQLAGDLAGTNSSATNPVISNAAINTVKIADNAVTNVKIGGVISVEKGGTGADLSSNAGYVKQATTGANFSTVSTIPVADVAGAVSSVNGVTPVNGNVSVLIGNVYTGNTITPTTGTTPIRSDIYIVSGQTGTPNDNGRTFIYDGSVWHEISTNVAALDNTFVKLSGSTMSGNLVFPTTRKITIDDAPTASTDVTNKDYVDTKIGGTGNTNFIPKFSSSKTLTNSSIFDNGNLGIGTSTPGNKLEITHGTAGNSGLRFTNLNSSSSASTSASKVLGLNSTGDVILTNIPGTQNIVSFSTANPNTGSPIFTPNTPIDQTVIYQSTVDNSLWTFNGNTYVTYTAPATTAWNLANTINDAGSNKTSSIWRSGGIIAGGTSSTLMYGNITANGGSNFSGVPAFGTASIGLIRNTAAGWTGSGFLFSNSTAGSNAFSMVYNNDKAYFGHLTPSNTYALYGVWNNTGFKLGENANTSAVNKLDVEGAVAIGSYAGFNSAPSNGLIVSGNVGIGANTPTTRLQVNSSIATNTVNTEGIFRLQRPQNPGVKWENIAQFNLGSYAVTTGGSTNATSRLDLAMNDGDGVATSNIMTWQANGNVGIGTTAPISAFSNTSSAIQGSNSTNAFTGGFTWSSPGTGFAGSFYSQPTNGNGLQVKIAGNTSANNALEVSSGATQTGSLTPLFNVLGNGNVGVGTSSPLTKLIVNDNAYISNIPTTTANLMDNSTFRPLTRFQTTSGINNNAISHYLTTTVAAIQAHNYSTGVSLPYVLQPAGGNVGIGTSAPSALLEITSPSGNGVAPKLRLTNPIGKKWELQSGISGINDTYFGIYNVTDNVQILTAKNTGEVGIGTTAPSAQLHTTGSVRFAGAGTPGAGKVLTSDASGNATWQNAVGSTTVSSKTADYILTSSDNAGFIVINSATLVTITVPSTLSAGFYCQIIQQGTGQVSVVGDTGVSVTSAMGTKSRTIGSSIGVILTTSTTAFLSGDTGF
ncbi:MULTISPECIES: beta strand repeat-containing protein [Flavobacterium]|uniref:Uncharacterized protein n=1 Tax=Flavobacterium keumense TaxID=1306518 RepID=A0ABY8N922_9FLAO|nr:MULTISPECIES: hypothetical protein [Flavobacterium]WGK95081.1 hypothetical protein MG292_02315 [Flavobacterium keumense]